MEGWKGSFRSPFQAPVPSGLKSPVPDGHVISVVNWAQRMQNARLANGLKAGGVPTCLLHLSSTY